MPEPDGVYALRYAYRTASYKGEHFYGCVRDCHDNWPIHYYIWVVVENGIPYLFDTGFSPQEAERRGNRTYLASPLELLRWLGFSPNDVPHVILSHLHYDHTGFINSFPRAQIWLQRREWDFWTTPLASRGAYAPLRNIRDITSIERLIGERRVNFVDGEATLTSGLSMHWVGGHTAGTQVVRVHTAAEVIVLASDASHFYANIDEDRPYGIVHELARMYEAFDTMRTLAGHDGVIVPGHDPEVIQRHRPLDSPRNCVIHLGRTYDEGSRTPGRKA